MELSKMDFRLEQDRQDLQKRVSGFCTEHCPPSVAAVSLVWYSPVVAAIVELDDAIVLVRNKDWPKWDSWIFFPNILRENI